VNEQPDETPIDEQGGAADATAAAAEIAALQLEKSQLEDQLRRAMADIANIRRRQQKEGEDSRRRVLEGLALELLPVLDNFKLALQAWQEQAAAADPTALVQGVRMVQSLLQSALERHGLQELEALGKPFDPSRHEAVAVEVQDGVPAGQVLRVLQSGYQIGDRVVRHAKVVVGGEQKPAAG
jgi:molecular chaperone GrpE